jgi:hypothetical protein
LKTSKQPFEIDFENCLSGGGILRKKFTGAFGLRTRAAVELVIVRVLFQKA